MLRGTIWDTGTFVRDNRGLSKGYRAVCEEQYGILGMRKNMGFRVFCVGQQEFHDKQVELYACML